jgi:predicted dienelactone hydrolase
MYPIRPLLLAFCIVAACVPAGAADRTHAQLSSQGSFQQFAGKGPFAGSVARNTVCCDRKGNPIRVYIPTARRGPFPLIVWANGTWSTTKKYDYLLQHLASWGYLIVSSEDSSAAKGVTVIDALHAAETKLPGVRIDRQRIAAVGHSQGATAVVNAAIAAPQAFRTVVAISLPDRRFCRRGDCDAIPGELSRENSVLLLAGAHDGISPPQTNARYFAGFATPRKARLTLRDADHNDVQGHPDCSFLQIGCRRGVLQLLPYLTTWLRWQLDGDARAAAAFRGNLSTGSRSLLSDRQITEALEEWGSEPSNRTNF